jgi:hypothetical protein
MGRGTDEALKVNGSDIDKSETERCCFRKGGRDHATGNEKSGDGRIDAAAATIIAAIDRLTTNRDHRFLENSRLFPINPSDAIIRSSS